MSINHLKTEITEVGKQIQKIEARKVELHKELEPIIDQHFSELIKKEQNPELRRDFAYLNSSKRFEIIDGMILRFSGRNISHPITFDIMIDDLLS